MKKGVTDYSYFLGTTYYTTVLRQLYRTTSFVCFVNPPTHAQCFKHIFQGYVGQYGDGADNAVENSGVFSLIRIRYTCRQQGHAGAVKLCSDKILQSLTGGAS